MSSALQADSLPSVCAIVHRVAKSLTWLLNWTTTPYRDALLNKNDKGRGKLFFQFFWETTSINDFKKENIKIELPYDLQSHFWACYQEKNMIPKDPCSTVFIAAVFTTARTWEQPNAHQQRNGWRRCSTYIQWNMTQPWKEWNHAVYTNMDEPRNWHTKWSNWNREGEISYDILFLWNLKINDTNELTYKTERDSLS